MCTCGISCPLPGPLFIPIVVASSSVARVMGLSILWSVVNSAWACSGVKSSILAACVFGMSSVCPGAPGRMSRNAMVCSSS